MYQFNFFSGFFCYFIILLIKVLYYFSSLLCCGILVLSIVLVVQNKGRYFSRSVAHDPCSRATYTWRRELAALEAVDTPMLRLRCLFRMKNMSDSFKRMLSLSTARAGGATEVSS